MRALAYVLLILGCFAFDMFSDVYLRTHHIAGVTPNSWDAFTTVGALLGGVLLVMDLFRDLEDK